ncbi:hypothetical protein [Terriglobus tenax]|uniref:hypothetical protein n=1 Tax=Terriglobus tenax TaxID=1111115 RepID=UPI0021E03EB4|nr:hypothetical protein [Terriglobus tenax]
MRNFVRSISVCAASLMFGVASFGQTATKTAAKATPFANVAVTYSLERSKAAGTSNYFWMNGATAEAAFRVRDSWSAAVSASGATTPNVGSSVGFNKFTLAGGPRYTLYKMPKFVPFGQVLFGYSHGWNSRFPGQPGNLPAATANAFAFAPGGGADVPLKNGFGLRVVQLEYVRTNFPNGTNKTQNDMKLSFGLSWHSH